MEPSPSPSVPAILGLHHFAWRCRDAEETRHLYEDLLGLPLYHMIRSETVPSTGELCPYTHVFFRLGDGSFVAFFDLGDDQVPEPSPNTPAWVHHLALRVADEDALLKLAALLRANGYEVTGPVDHRIFRSIYFFDPNGLRVELTAQLADAGQMQAEARDVHQRLEEWNVEKARLRAERCIGPTIDA